MHDNTQVQLGKGQIGYRRLDRLLLYLLAVELGYFVFLVVVGAVVAILVYAVDFEALGFAIGTWEYATSILWPVLFFFLALVFMLPSMAGTY